MNQEIPFLGEELSSRNYSSSKIVIFPCPYEKTTTYMTGTAEGPRAILRASEQVEFFDPETQSDPSRQGIHTFPVLDYSTGTQEDCLQETQILMEKAFLDGKFVITFGGEHTISLSAIRAASQAIGADSLSVLHLDAHSDMRDHYENNKYSHACVMRRVHETVKHTYSVGIRAQCEEEYEYLKTNSNQFGVLYDHERASRGLLVEEAEKYLPTEKVYITIDLDFFSPREIPSVGTPVPGGGSWYETLGFLKAIFTIRNVVGFDIVELRPDKNIRSDFFAALLAYKLMAYKYSSHSPSTQLKS